MGKGAPVKHSSIPTKAIVEIFAWEGMLYEAQRLLGSVLKDILDGNDSPENWVALDTHRKAAVFYSMQYTKAILSLQHSQNRG